VEPFYPVNKTCSQLKNAIATLSIEIARSRGDFMKLPSYEFALRRMATILSVVLLSFAAIAAISGVLISFYYEPTAGGAYNSLKTIALEVPNGWLIRNLHNIAGNGLIVVSLCQIVVMFLGEKFRRSWLTAWISGILLSLTAIGLGWTAMILDWSQIGYWRFRIELGTIESIPVIGETLRNILTGGAVNSLTVNHLYTLHSYILAIGAMTLAIIHLCGLLSQEREEKQDRLSKQSNEQLSATTD
jgi:cytochrome b6